MPKLTKTKAPGVRLTAILTRPLAGRLRRYARTTHRSMSGIVTQAVADFLDTQEEKK